MKIKNIFITGGLGFIGTNLVKSLMEKGYNIKIYDNHSSGNIEKLKRLGVNPNSNNITIVNADVLDAKKLTKHMQKADYVIHHAAQLEITKAISDPLFDLETNTIGTLNILNAMLENKVKYLTNASSACIYGQKLDNEIPVKENVSTNPNWAYGVSKLAAEKYCSIYADLYKLKIISARYAIIYGQNEWYGRVMTLFIKNMLEGKSLVVFGNGLQKRDFTNIHDVVAFNLKALNYMTGKVNKQGLHEIFNVSTGVGTTIKDLALLIKELALGYDKIIDIYFDKNIKEGEKSEFINRVRLPSELQNLVLDNSKAKNMLNWKPINSLSEGLKEQIAWARKNLDLWKTMSY